MIRIFLFSEMSPRNLKALSSLRQIFKELRYTNEKWQESQEVKFIKQYAHEHKLTQKLLGKAPKKAEHIASCYAFYLSSSRQLAEMQSRYASNEKSVEESANLVGLRLPKQNM